MVNSQICLSNSRSTNNIPAKYLLLRTVTQDCIGGSLVTTQFVDKLRIR